MSALQRYYDLAATGMNREDALRLARTPRRFKAGAVVCWTRIDGQWATGEYLGLAPGDSGEGDAFVAVRASNGVVHIRESALS
jgi:hypothetical protein